MNEELKKYYQLVEITKADADMLKMQGEDVYKRSRKYYTLSWGHEICAPDGSGGMLKNTDIDGVIEAADDADAAKKLGLTAYTA